MVAADINPNPNGVSRFRRSLLDKVVMSDGC